MKIFYVNTDPIVFLKFRYELWGVDFSECDARNIQIFFINIYNMHIKQAYCIHPIVF